MQRSVVGPCIAWSLRSRVAPAPEVLGFAPLSIVMKRCTTLVMSNFATQLLRTMSHLDDTLLSSLLVLLAMARCAVRVILDRVRFNPDVHLRSCALLMLEQGASDRAPNTIMQSSAEAIRMHKSFFHGTVPLQNDHRVHHLVMCVMCCRRRWLFVCAQASRLTYLCRPS